VSQAARVPARVDRSPGSTLGLKLVRGCLSIFIIYHFVVVGVLPNSSSIVGRTLSRFLLPYANLFGFNTSWQFFSPGPAETFFLEYQVESAKSGEDLDTPTLLFPPKRSGYSFDDFYSRRLYSMRFFVIYPDRLQQFFIPFLCRQNPGATGIWVESVFERLPSLEKLSSERTSLHDLAERSQLPRQRFPCAGGESWTSPPNEEPQK
jgi:hypothetical protein